MVVVADSSLDVAQFATVEFVFVALEVLSFELLLPDNLLQFVYCF